MRRERKENIVDSILVKVIWWVFLIAIFVASSVIITNDYTLNGVKNALYKYFVNAGLTDSSVFELEDLEEQIRVIAETVREQQSASEETVSNLKNLLLLIGYDSDTVDSLSENEMIEMLSVYLTSIEADTDTLDLQYAELQQDYEELSSKTLAELSAPSMIVNGESISTTLKDYVAVINGKNYYSEFLLNGYILSKDIMIDNGILYYDQTASERVNVVTNNLYHDDTNGAIVKETSNYILGTRLCTYGFVGGGHSSNSSVLIECDGNYSEMVFNLGYVNDTGTGDRTLNIYYLSGDDEYVLTYSKSLFAGMLYYEEESCQIYNTQRVKVEITSRYINDNSKFALSDIYLLK